MAGPVRGLDVGVSDRDGTGVLARERGLGVEMCVQHGFGPLKSLKSAPDLQPCLSDLKLVLGSIGPVLCASPRAVPLGRGSSPPALSPFFWKTLNAMTPVEFRVKQQLVNWDVCELTFCVIVMYVS